MASDDAAVHMLTVSLLCFTPLWIATLASSCLQPLKSVALGGKGGVPPLHGGAVACGVAMSHVVAHAAAVAGLSHEIPGDVGAVEPVAAGPGGGESRWAKVSK